MDQIEFIKLAEEILEVEPGTLGMGDNLDEIDWDSLANISFIAEIDARMNKSINADKLAKSETMTDLFMLVSGSGENS
ncbi:hypothetical protein OIU93_20345 [Paeniglutamicibacter sp. ZC-3]|uniref:phosphopantetheine-binding protein n=1 Tax=Paeniglutamicibacter sp. ZC-3 TaxID=2986919 RepID=UPI0021F6B171|nr:phosphopantetheine-binding protein [Paeniglutamicibacter sp. ZC-3]MCV9996605.1 hypothetical protein [Paeniglutamicibacter sp. ZC-3]